MKRSDALGKGLCYRTAARSLLERLKSYRVGMGETRWQSRKPTCWRSGTLVERGVQRFQRPPYVGEVGGLCELLAHTSADWTAPYYLLAVAENAYSFLS